MLKLMDIKTDWLRRAALILVFATVLLAASVAVPLYAIWRGLEEAWETVCDEIPDTKRLKELFMQGWGGQTPTKE